MYPEGYGAVQEFLAKPLPPESSPEQVTEVRLRSPEEIRPIPKNVRISQKKRRAHLKSSKS